MPWEGFLFPALISENYSEDFSLGLMTTSGSLGLHFPPSLPIILYGFISGVSIEQLFMAGLLPGILMVGILCLFSVYMGRKWRIARPPFSGSEFRAALKGAVWELPIPVLILGGIYSGFCTATEAAALTVVYVLLVKTLVFRELHLIRDLPAIMKESMQMVGGIMIILGAALAFTNYLVDAFIPMKILAFMEGLVETKIGFLIVLNIFLILVGCMMDIFSAILVVVPLIVPLADRFRGGSDTFGHHLSGQPGHRLQHPARGPEPFYRQLAVRPTGGKALQGDSPLSAAASFHFAPDYLLARTQSFSARPAETINVKIHKTHHPCSSLMFSTP